MGKARRKRQKQRRVRRRGTWWVAGIAAAMPNGLVTIVPPVLGLAYDDQDRAIVRATLAATVWAKAMGWNNDEELMDQSIQALPVNAGEAAQVQKDLKALRQHHPSPHGREAARIALGDSKQAEKLPIPEYISNLDNPSDAASGNADRTVSKLPETK